MKNSFSKIVIFALTLALAACACFAVSAAAEGEEANGPTIISKNMEYGEKFAIMYAVDAATVAEGPVTLKIYSDSEKANLVASYTAAAPKTEKINGIETSVYVFTTNGIAPKDVADVFYAQATDAKGNVGDMVSYSVVEYMLERLYGGYTLSPQQTAMYKKSIEFGEAAQNLLAPDDEIRVNDYKYVRVEGGTVNGVAKGMFLKDTVLTPALDAEVPAGSFLYGWNIATDAGESFEKELTTLTLTDSVVLSADVGEKDEFGYFENYGGYNFTGWTNATKGTTCFDLSRCTTMNIERKNGYMSIATKDAGTRMYLTQRTLDDGNSVMGIGANEWGTEGGPKLALHLMDGDADSYVFETDICFEESAVPKDYYILDVAFASTVDSATNLNASYKIMCVDAENGIFDVLGYNVGLNTWFNLAVEYFPGEGVANYYFNGRLAYTAECEKTDAAMEYVYLNSSPYQGTHLMFDNVHFSKKAAHLEESDTYSTFNNGETLIINNFENKSGSSSAGVAEFGGEKAFMLDKAAGGEDRVWFNTTKAQDATKFVFETKFFVDANADGNMYFDFMNGSTVTGVYGVMMKNNGTLLLSDYYKHNGTAANSFSDTTYYIGGAQWIDIKLVGYINDSDIWNVEIWINGTLMHTSTSSNWTATKATDITAVRFRTFSALDADIYFDDIRAEQIAE